MAENPWMTDTLRERWIKPNEFEWVKASEAVMVKRKPDGEVGIILHSGAWVQSDYTLLETAKLVAGKPAD